MTEMPNGNFPPLFPPLPPIPVKVDASVYQYESVALWILLDLTRGVQHSVDSSMMERAAEQILKNLNYTQTFILSSAALKLHLMAIERGRQIEKAADSSE